MAIEIERKYLVDKEKLMRVLKARQGKNIIQGYLNLDPSRSVRVRVKNNTAFLTIKGKSDGISRQEFEYEIPTEEANEMMKLCTHEPIIKKRYEIKQGNHIWEVDVFEGANDGLVLAEIELTSEQEAFVLPEWILEDVSEKKEYYNLYLYQNPFKK